MKKYQIIYADPPWEYSFPHTRKIAQDDYPTMSLDNIKHLSVFNISADNAILLLWVNTPRLKEGFEVITAWGFEYKTIAFTWVKTNSNSMGLFWGMGQYTRSNTENCLLATRGNGLKVISHSVHQVLMSPIQEHSRKPIIVRDFIVQLFGDLPRIELFARHKVEGWDCWGNEVESDIEL